MSFLPLILVDAFLNSQNSRLLEAASKENSGSVVTMDKDKFQVDLDVSQYSPHEISVKRYGNHIIIETKHEEKKNGHGFTSRHFVRKYEIPEGHDMGNVTSTISSNRILSVSVPKVTPEAATRKDIPVLSTGRPAIEEPK